MDRSMVNGFVYVATGEKYLKEAELSAKSLRNCSPGAKICLITDEVYESSAFDEIRLIPFDEITEQSWKANLVYKVLGIINTPFEHTIFVDTDMYFVHPVDDLFKLLDHFDILACLDYYDQSKINYNNSNMPHYTPYNTGMLVYRQNNEVSRFLKSWKECYEKNLDIYWSDQPAFMEALITHNIKMYILHSSFNFRFLFNVGFLENEKVRIIHGRATEDELKIIAERVNATLDQRVWVASLRKCFTWESNLRDRILRKIYQMIPAPIKKFYRRIR